MGKEADKLLYLETYGCQMNEYDSDRIRRILNAELTDNPSEADYIIVNTCAIREKADQKALSSVGRFKYLKKRNPDLVIGVAGCVAQLYGDKLKEKMPHIDFILGPRAIPRLPSLLKEIYTDRCTIVETSLDVEETFEVMPYHEEGKPTAFVSIQQGCNKRCAYCIVPTVRGSEVNRPLDDILKEVEFFAGKGVKEITLIGQTVNSWKYNGYKFGDLLSTVSEIEEIERIRFTTSYPRDITKKMIDAMKSEPKVCRHIHLPVQSGSDRILKLMNRTYTRQWYIDSVNRLKDAMPDIAISTDIIIGFPGETDKDFEDTMTLLEEVQFDSSFSFKFSPRPGTPGMELAKKYPVYDEVSSKRLWTFQKAQRKITLKKNLERVGQIEKVLVESESKQSNSWLTGRTSHNRIVNFRGNKDLIGKIVEVRIKEGLPNSLRGELVNNI